MKKAPIPANEADRQAALLGMNILDTPPEERFDRITKRAVKELNVPISTLSIIDADREWFKSCQGLPVTEGDRAVSFCGHALFSRQAFIIADTAKDPRFSDNPYVVGPPFIRFYAGLALYDIKSGQPVAVFCIKDTRPRSFEPYELGLFLKLAKEAEHELNNRQF